MPTRQEHDRLTALYAAGALAVLAVIGIAVAYATGNLGGGKPPAAPVVQAPAAPHQGTTVYGYYWEMHNGQEVRVEKPALYVKPDGTYVLDLGNGRTADYDPTQPNGPAQIISPH